MTCMATATLVSLGGNDIVFQVEADCSESAGSITYDYKIERGGVIGNPITRTCTWTRRIGEASFVVADVVLLAEDESFDSAEATQVECDCPETEQMRTA